MAGIEQVTVDGVELAPLVAQVGRQPQQRAESEEEMAEHAAGDDIGQLLTGLQPVRHPQIANQQRHPATGHA
jgi:hypothetical protein